MHNHKLKRYLITSTIFGFIILLFSATVSFSNPSGHIMNMALTPSDAIQDMMQVQRNNIHDFRIIQSTWIDLRHQVALFRYTIPSGVAHEEFGIATVAMRKGWSAYPGELFGLAFAPAPISYSSIETQGHTMIYDVINDQKVYSIQITFNTGVVQQQKQVTDGFLFVVEGKANISQLDVIDENGKIIFTSLDPELNTEAHW